MYLSIKVMDAGKGVGGERGGNFFAVFCVYKGVR